MSSGAHEDYSLLDEEILEKVKKLNDERINQLSLKLLGVEENRESLMAYISAEIAAEEKKIVEDFIEPSRLVSPKTEYLIKLGISMQKTRGRRVSDIKLPDGFYEEMAPLIEVYSKHLDKPSVIYDGETLNCKVIETDVSKDLEDSPEVARAYTRICELIMRYADKTPTHSDDFKGLASVYNCVRGLPTDLCNQDNAITLANHIQKIHNMEKGHSHGRGRC